MSGSKGRGAGKDLREEIDLRLDGLLGELGRTLGDMIERLDGGAGEVRKSRSFDTGRGPVKAEAGIRIRVAGQEVSEVRSRRPGTAADAPRPPAVRPIDASIQHGAALWTLTADLPGVSEADLSLTETDGHLHIAARARHRSYEGSFELPPGVTLAGIEILLRNGILDLTARLSGPEEP